MKQLTKQIKIGEYGIDPNHVFIKNSILDGEMRVCITKDPAITETDEATYARIVDSFFQDGTIEVKVRSRCCLMLLIMRRDSLALHFGLMRQIQNLKQSIFSRRMADVKNRCEEIELCNILCIQILNTNGCEKNFRENMKLMLILELMNGFV